MAFAVAHVLSTVLLLDIFRNRFKKFKRKIPMHHIYIAGIFSIIPDIDFGIYWILSLISDINLLHKAFTHTILVPFAILIAAFFVFRVNKSWGRIVFLCSLAYFGHLFLDYLVGWPFAYLWPFTLKQYTCPFVPDMFKTWVWWAAIDAGLLMIWLFWSMKIKGIKRFI